MSLRYADIKAMIAQVANLAVSDSRVLELTNQAIEGLIYEGQMKGTTFRYQVCVNQQCLVWPREVETILAAWVSNKPLLLRGRFYEALENGPGLLQSDNCHPKLTLVDRGETVTFDWITATGYQLAIYADGTEAAGTVLIRYYDSNGNKVYTDYLGQTIEGERLAIPAAGAYTIGTYEVLPMGIYAVIKPVTKRVIRLYARKISDGTLIPLAYYEPDETIPEYRHSYLSDLCPTTGDCGTTQVTIEAKLRPIPAINDDSILQISHRRAIRLAVQAIQKETNNLANDAVKYWALAVDALGKQLHHHRGAGQVDPVRMVGSETFGGGGVCNLV